MKKWIGLLLVLGLLCGCTGQAAQTTAPGTTEPTAASTAPEPVETTVPVPTLLDQAQVWNESGDVLVLPLEVLENTEWVNVGFFGKQLLVWEITSGDYQAESIDLWLVELEHGQTVAQCTVPLVEYCVPQIQSDRICICDNGAGVVTVLNENLEVTDQWETEPGWNLWFMGSGSTLYQTVDARELISIDLETGEKQVILDRINGIYTSGLEPDRAGLYYVDVDTAARCTAFLDYETGTFAHPPMGGAYSDCQNSGAYWLCRSDLDGRIYHLGNGEDSSEITLEGGLLKLTEQGMLMERHADGERLNLYDIQGKFIAGCDLGQDVYLGNMWPEWSDVLGGYVMLADSMDWADQKLLLWLPETGTAGTDLTMTPVQPEEIIPDTLEELRIRADAIGEQYGLKIWLGNECQTEFSDFTAEWFLDPILVARQLDILEQALMCYPEGFFYQLRYSSYQQIHIHLVQNLMAKSHYGTGGSYGAFVQPLNGYYLMVVNCNYAAEGTYYHEFSHIIDDYLEWDSWQREDALYSEEAWASLNPDDFSYTWDYGVCQEFEDEWYAYFIDQYAMTNPTEDRARTMEYGMLGYMQWRFDEMPGVVEKLRYYSACIRDAFDTTLWPEQVLWEQYIP